MRPSRRFLNITAAALALSALVIATGAVPPEVLMLVWAALIAVAVFDLAASPGRRAISVAFDGPDEVFSGEAAGFSARVTGPSGLPDRLDAVLEVDDALGRSRPFSIARIGQTSEGRIEVPAKRRGVFDIAALWLSWRSRLGLWDIGPRIAQDRTLKIVPNIRPVSSGQIDVTVRSDLYGVKDTAMRGEGSEFHQLIEFAPGMDPRSIDWKHSARMNQLVAKEMRAERNHQVILCLDNGYLMREEIAGLPRIDHAINAALAMVWAAGLGGDLAGLYSFDSEPRDYVPPQPARAAFPQLRARTAELAYSSVETNYTLALAHLNGRLNRRSLIIIFSDFVDTTTAELLVENIGVLAKTHVLVFVTLRDPSLEGRVRADKPDLAAMAEAVVAADMLRERQTVLDRLARMGVMVIDTEPGQLTPRLISTYLMIKAREMI